MVINDFLNNFKSDYDSLYDIKSGILGLVVGDALGVPHEFNPRSCFDLNPVTDMVGYGTYNLPAGTWSDDSSLTLATLDSLSKGLNYEDIMSKFSLWLDCGDYTPLGEVFDIGNTTHIAILNYRDAKFNGDLSDNDLYIYGLGGENNNGNGSLMRILPVAFFIYYLKEKLSISFDEQLSIVHNISSLTHAHKRSLIGCGIYVQIAIEILKYKSLDDYCLNYDILDKVDCENCDILISLIYKGIKNAEEYYGNNEEFKHQYSHYEHIFNFEVKDYTRDDISGSGYVVNSLTASIWCLLNTNSYKECVLAAVNLGKDTDTTAAIVGGLAGLYYGFDDIPKEWLNKIAKLDYIEELISNFDNYIKNP